MVSDGPPSITTHDDFLTADEIRAIMTGVDARTLKSRGTHRIIDGIPSGWHRDGCNLRTSVPRTVVDRIYGGNSTTTKNDKGEEEEEGGGRAISLDDII
jgi:hypothetical protein